MVNVTLIVMEAVPLVGKYIYAFVLCVLTIKKNPIENVQYILLNSHMYAYVKLSELI